MTEESNIPEILQEEEPSSFKLISALGLAGLFAGIALVGVYLYTLPMIEANKAEALQRAIFKVLPNCDSFKTLEMKEGILKEVDETNTNKAKGKGGAETKKIYAGFDVKKEFIGFAIPGREPGFQDIIGALIGYDASKKVIIGFEVLESKETPGLGDKIFKDAAFQTNFISLAVDPKIISVKKGQKKNPNEVEAITGATISSKAVARLLDNTIREWREPIDEYLQTNDMSLNQDVKEKMQDGK
jgi:H+/Na+-translocating ferredoxin:NAD+ oxidoreductase subunit G